MLPLFPQLSAARDPGLSLVLWFICILFSLRLVPAVLRKVLPFSQEVTAVWAERRTMAKRFDSYQWRKLFWFGLGLSAYAVTSGHLGGVGAAVTVFCLIGGGLGSFVWKRRTATGQAPLVQ